MLTKNGGQSGWHPIFGYVVRMSSGHWRVTSRKGEWRDWLVHRCIVTVLVRDWNFYGWRDIPHGWVIHHMDFNPGHNCACNLLVMEHWFHSKMEGGRVGLRGKLGRFLGKQKR